MGMCRFHFLHLETQSVCYEKPKSHGEVTQRGINRLYLTALDELPADSHHCIAVGFLSRLGHVSPVQPYVIGTLADITWSRTVQMDIVNLC